MNENKLKFSVDTERLFKLGPNFLQSKDGQKALADGSLKSEDRLFMALSSSTRLNTTLLLPGKKLIELGEQFDDLWHECLESSYGFLRASWPRNWLGMPFVLLECLRF
jgi:hypothetical protein